MSSDQSLLPPRPQCAVCESKDHLSKCAGCKTVWCCGREHQTSDWDAQHKAQCTAVKKTRKKLEAEETKLREQPGDMFCPANPFENSVGHFWGILETRDYMRARFAHVEALLKINTFEAVRTALQHLEDMLRLCRGDNMGVRSLMPSLYIRLGRDQECYDFVKWWVVISEDSHYDWGNTDLPYLDIHGADAFEPVDKCRPRSELAHLVSLTLLKTRLLLDLRSLQNAAAVGEKVPQEILDGIREQMVSPILKANHNLFKDIMSGKSLAPHLADLESQVRELYECGKKDNKYIWPALLSPGDNLTARPPYTSSGTPAEMQLALQYSYRAWVETPGAINVIRGLTTAANGRS